MKEDVGRETLGCAPRLLILASEHLIKSILHSLQIKMSNSNHIQRWISNQDMSGTAMGPEKKAQNVSDGK